MDNIHEEILSNFADTFNKILKSAGNNYRVFSWRKWHKHINAARDLVQRIGVGINRYCPEASPTVDAMRLSRYFWAKGIWKTSIGKDNLGNSDRWDSYLLKTTLGLTLKDLKKASSEEYFYKAHHLPYWGLIEQYLCRAYFYDTAEDRDANYKNAEKLSATSFASHRFNWLLHRHEIIAEFKCIKKEIDIVKVPLCSTKKARKIVSNSLDKEYYTDIFYVPDPLKSFMEVKDKSFKETPSNFQWLIRVMSEICETNSEDMYKQYLKVENRYLTAINSSERDYVKIAFAEGENVSDLKT